VINLMDALRRSVEADAPKEPAAGQSKARRPASPLAARERRRSHGAA